MDLQETLQALATTGNEATRKTDLRHGAQPPLLGVKYGDEMPDALPYLERIWARKR